MSFSKKKTFDRTSQKVLFDSIFTNPEMGEAFYNFLKKEKCGEQWEFLQSIKLLSHLCKEKIDEKAIAHVKYIFSEFIDTNSLRELNLSGALKKRLCKKISDAKQWENMKEWKLNESPMELFHEVVEIIKLELYSDSFPRFTSSKQCSRVVYKYVHDRRVVNLKETMKLEYSIEDFKEPIVTDIDFDFMKHLLNDNHDWEISGTRFANAFISDVNPLKHIPIFKNAVLIRFDIIFDVPFEKALCSYLPVFAIKKFDPNVHNITMRKWISSKELEKYNFRKKRSIAVMDYEIKLPFPFQTFRKSPQAFSLEYDHAEKSCYLVGKTYEWLEDKIDLQMPLYKKQLRKFLIDGEYKEIESYYCPTLCCNHYKALDDQRTILQQVILVDSNGFVSTSFFKTKTLQTVINKRRAMDMRALLNKLSTDEGNVTIEQSKYILEKDPYGKLLLEGVGLL